MNVEMLAYFVLGIIGMIAALSLGLLGWFTSDHYLKWSEANRRAGELLRSVLTREQYRQTKRPICRRPISSHRYGAVIEPVAAALLC